MYEVNLKMRVSDEFLQMWCVAKGYQAAIVSPTIEGGTEVTANSETPTQYFERVAKQELLDVCTVPIKNMVFDTAAQQAQAQSDMIRGLADESMHLSIEDLTE